MGRGLAGIEGFSNLVVIVSLDRAERRRAAGTRRAADGAAGLPPVGFFATRTPKRPNPIGIACPRLLCRDGNRLVVSGIDAWDGTPILDIKGSFPRDEGRPDATVPAWLGALWAGHDRERGATGASEGRLVRAPRSVAFGSGARGRGRTATWRQRARRWQR